MNLKCEHINLYFYTKGHSGKTEYSNKTNSNL